MIQTANKIKRCAIYTRKSHEEGLEQDFNSLDAQREAGMDYIKSQKFDGWQLLEKQYDDGGFSGGNLKRPAMDELINDIKQQRIDIVIVYKVDRLSRSLSDFASLVKLFDEHEISFVSVTQQFNTTTSMGRLTLNMLLSFAQFEREVTGERIRDKIAATKKKGYWITGQPPLGYRAVEKKLKIYDEEVELVRKIYQGYLDEGSLITLGAKLTQEGYTTKQWISSRNIEHGGKRLTPNYLHRILINPVYIGKIRHKKEVWPGFHKPIIKYSLWKEVQDAIANKKRKTNERWDYPFLLKGRLRIDDQYAMSPGSVQRKNKTTGMKNLIRYYVSQRAIKLGYKACEVKSINAVHLDTLSRNLLINYLENNHPMGRFELLPIQAQDHWLRNILSIIYLAPDQMTIHLDKKEIVSWQKTFRDKHHVNPSVNLRRKPQFYYKPSESEADDKIILSLQLQIKKLDGKRVLLSPDGQDLLLNEESKPREQLVESVGQAYHWLKRLKADPNLTIRNLAKEEQVSFSKIHKKLPLTNLCPDILKSILSGTLPARITLSDLFKAGVSLDWKLQREYLNLN